MSLVYTVSILTAKRGPLSIDQIAADPDCEEYTREQVLGAVRNACTRKAMHCISPNGRVGIYAYGPPPDKKAKAARPLPANSIFQLGERAAEGAQA
jgi:hypothetical protein